jgi:hypothetical protein
VNSSAEILVKIKAARTAALHAAADKILANESVNDDIDRIKNYDTLLQLSQPRHNIIVAGALVGATCLFVASLFWVERVYTTPLRASVTTNAVTLRLAKEWAPTEAWQLQGGVFRLEQFTSIGLPPELSAPQQNLTDQALLDVEGGHITVSELTFSAGERLTIQRNTTGAVYIFSHGAPFSGEVQISGDPAVSVGDASLASVRLAAKTIDIPATVSFYDIGRPSIPAVLRLTPSDKNIWRNIPIEALSFSIESMEGLQESQFVSGIQSGEIRLSDTGDEIRLRDGEQLHMGVKSGTIDELQIGPKAIQVSFEAVASDLSAGATGFERNLVPTWLDYIYHQKRFGFFWGAVAFLWGILWSARHTLFG